MAGCAGSPGSFAADVLKSRIVDEWSAGLGRRIQVVGPSCAGKSTLGAALADRLGLEFLELDALFWLPDWTEPSEEAFAEALRRATAGGRWVMAGNYFRHTSERFWNEIDTVIWLDFPLRIVLPRIVRRSWRRYRNNELLWGTNHERFWPMWKLWRQDSLLGYTISRHKLYGERLRGAQGDPRFAHIQWVRLRGPKAVQRWLDSGG
jgi:adenylate kinase family enzyme